MSLFGRAEKRENAALKADKQRLAEQRDEARGERDAALGNEQRIAQRFTAVHNENQLLKTQLADALKRVGVDQAAEVERLTRDLDAERRQREHLQKQFDGTLGVDHPDVEAGASWQARRVDKAGGAKC